MAFRPGVSITSSDAAPTSGDQTATGTWFITALTERGPSDKPVRLSSLTAFTRTFGGRLATFPIGFDSVETFFREGGASVVVSRVTGPAPVAASATLTDGTTGVVKLTARSVGEYANSFNVQVVSATGGTQIVLTSGGVEIERSPVVSTKADVLAWAANSSVVSASALTSSNPVTVQAAQPFTGGTADVANITDAQHVAALARLTDDLGPGQVSSPGRTTTVAHQSLLDHAAANNRVALLDAPVDAETVTALVTAANGVKSSVNAQYGSLWAPWAKIAATTGTSTRTVPPSAVQAGIEARRDAVANPNKAAAGPKFPTRSVQSLNVVFTAQQGDALNEAGVSLYRSIRSVVMPYGYRTVADQNLYPNWKFFNHARTRMALKARAGEVAESFVFEQIDGRGVVLGAFQAALKAICSEFYAEDALFGAEPDDAFRVLVGTDINPIEGLANGNIAAVIQARFSPFAELVSVEIVKTPTSQNLA